MYIGVYYGMPIVLLIFAVLGTFKGVGWKRLALGMILTGVLVWGLPNVISYTTAQFLGWDHGRFGAGRGPAIAETSAGKVLTGLQIGGITSLVGAAWLIVWSTILIWLPGKFGGGAAVEAAAETVGEVSDEESPTPHTSNPR
jgi:hypothetical protein